MNKYEDKIEFNRHSKKKICLSNKVVLLNPQSILLA